MRYLTISFMLVLIVGNKLWDGSGERDQKLSLY